MNPVVTVLWVVVPVLIALAEGAAAVFCYRRYRAIRGLPGSLLLRIMTIAVAATALAQVLNVVLAISTLLLRGADQLVATVIFLGLFFGGQLVKGIVIVWAMLQIWKAQRGSAS